MTEQSPARPLLAGVTCPACGHVFDPYGPDPVRVTENAPALAAEADDPAQPYGDVDYADPGYQPDGKKRYPIDTKAHIRAAWSYINQQRNAGKYTKRQLKTIKSRIKAAARRMGIKITETTKPAPADEALISGKRSYDDIRELVRASIEARVRAATGHYYCYVWVVDLTDTDVVYSSDGGLELYQCPYTIDDAGEVSLGEPVRVLRTYTPDPAAAAATEAQPARQELRDRVPGRVLEAKGKAKDGGPIYWVRIIAYGESKNGRRYTEAVLRDALPLYEGAKAYDHHRTEQEMRSGTIAGLVGYYRDVQAGEDGLEADLHLLPSATHAAEALDAALQAQADGLDPMVGISHDVLAVFTPVSEGGRTLHDAVRIVTVASADVVSDPAAGGKPVRAVAGGHDPAHPPGSPPAPRKEQAVDPKQIREALGLPADATDDQVAAKVTAVREALGLPADTPAEEVARRVAAARETKPAPSPAPAPAPAGEPTPASENGVERTSFLGRLMIKEKVSAAGLPEPVAESITGTLPDRITEAQVDSAISALKAAAAIVERADLKPTFGADPKVTQEARDKKIAALDATFAGDYSKGYRSFREAYLDFTGHRPRAFDEDLNRRILRESFGHAGYDSAMHAPESLDTGSWAQALGDSVTRRMIAMYGQPNLQTWRKIVSSTPPVNDFREQKRERIGGYGLLPVVNQGAPYQPLQSPTDEEAVYAVIKRGGTDDLTLEIIANDDLGAIVQIPRKLGLAAAITLYRFVWDTLPTNAATTYDAVALFHASHNNTDNPAVLSQSTLSVARRRMREQVGFGDQAAQPLSLVPRLLVVPPELEEIAFQLTRSAVAIPSTPAGPSDTPNIHQGMDLEVIDYFTDANDWYTIADPVMCPLLEVGFYQGRTDPELFTQSDPTVGSVFTADKFTWKIRHIYSGTPLDHRGMYRGANA